jgi:hypothetical protein
LVKRSADAFDGNFLEKTFAEFGDFGEKSRLFCDLTDKKKFTAARILSCHAGLDAPSGDLKGLRFRE